MTTLIGVFFTVAVAWYQLSEAAKQDALAEQERARSVRETLIVMVEEHILNGSPIEPERFSRLIEERRRQERVQSAISVLSVLQRAEFNIMNSRYLSFERKTELKPIIDRVYLDLSKLAYRPISEEHPNFDLISRLAGDIQSGNSSEALEALSQLVEVQAEYAKSARDASRDFGVRDFIKVVLDNPFWFLAFISCYLLGTYVFIVNRRRLWRRRIWSS